MVSLHSLLHTHHSQNIILEIQDDGQKFATKLQISKELIRIIHHFLSLNITAGCQSRIVEVYLA